MGSQIFEQTLKFIFVETTAAAPSIRLAKPARQAIPRSAGQVRQRLKFSGLRRTGADIFVAEVRASPAGECAIGICKKLQVRAAIFHLGLDRGPFLASCLAKGRIPCRAGGLGLGGPGGRGAQWARFLPRYRVAYLCTRHTLGLTSSSFLCLLFCWYRSPLATQMPTTAALY